MAEWLVEEGIGETRAALVERGELIEARVELPGALRAGAIIAGRLAKVVATGRVGIVSTAAGDMLVQPLARGVTEGAGLAVEITREAIGAKAAQARPAGSGARERDGPALLDRVAASGVPVRRVLTHESDALEEAGWSDTLESALSGRADFPGGALRIALTEAMTVIDVDGTLAPVDLALAGAAAAGAAIRRFDIAGSIGIDLPTLCDRARRSAAAAALDAHLPQPFERTAVNGFGFMQIVRPQARASLLQFLASDRVGAAARALLRAAERAPGAGTRILSAHPKVAHRIEAMSWLEELMRRTGARATLRPDATQPISGFDVQTVATL